MAEHEVTVDVAALKARLLADPDVRHVLPRVDFSGLISNGDKSTVMMASGIDPDNEFAVKVNALDETRLMEGMQKVANRIATGLVLAALIVGAALLMRVETSFHLFGYPGLAILLFLAAAIGGLGLVFTIMVNDIRARRVRGRRLG